MLEFGLRNDIPDEASTIEIYAMVKPATSSIEVRRSPGDDQPIVMSPGMRTILGVPEGRKLYISKSSSTENFKIFVAGRFHDRVEQPHDG